MKQRILAVFLCFGLLIALAGCGNETISTPASNTKATTPEAFGDMSLADTPIQEAETTALPASAPAEETSLKEEDLSALDDSASAEEPVEALDFTEQAIIAAIICDAVDMLEYNPADDQYLWRSVGYLIGQIGTDADLITMEDSFGKVAAENAPIFANAIYADFSGNMPSVTEEDPLISMDEDGGYLINMLDQGELELKLTENRLTADTGTFTEEAELIQNGESLGSYTITLTPYTGNSVGARYFAYSILDVVLTDGANGA